MHPMLHGTSVSRICFRVQLSTQPCCPAMPVASHTWLLSHSVLELHTSLCPLSQVALHEQLQAGEGDMNTLLFATTAVTLQGSLVSTLILERTCISINYRSVFKKGESNLLMFYKFSGSYFCMHLPQQYILTPGRFHCRILIVYDAPQVSKFQLERVWGQDCLVAMPCGFACAQM